jgi:transposase
MDVSNHLPLAELQRRQRAEKDAYVARNLQIIVLALQGWTAPAVAMAVGLTRRVVQQRVYDYNEHGPAFLEEQRGAPLQPLLSPDEEESFRERVESGPQPKDEVCSLRGKDFQRILADEFGKVLHLSTIYNLLHKLHYSYLQPRPRHQYNDPARQQAFIAGLPDRLAQIAGAHPGQRLRIYFEDEARFGQQGSITRMWAKTGSRPAAVRQTAYQYLWVLAAVCPETGASAGLLAPRLNTRYVNAFLQEFSQTLAADEHAVLLWDGAGFHRSGELQVPANITTVQLPPYSPELNPIENLWHYLKSHHWSNRTYADADALEAAAMQAWRTSVANPELLKTVCSAKIYQGAVIR